MQKWMHSGCTVLPDNEKTKLGSSNQKAFSAMSHMKVCLYNYLRWCGYSRYFTTDALSKSVIKITPRIDVSRTRSLPLWILAIFRLSEMYILSKVCKQITSNHTTLWKVALPIFDLFVLISFFESNSPDIFAFCVTDLNESIDSSNVSVRGYLPLIRKDYVTHMHGLVVYMKKGLPFGTYLYKTLRFLLCVFHWLYFVWCPTSFSINHCLRLCAHLLILFHLTLLKFCQPIC